MKELLGPVLGSKVIGVTPGLDDPFHHHPRQAEVELYFSELAIEDSPWMQLMTQPLSVGPMRQFIKLMVDLDLQGKTAKNFERILDTPYLQQGISEVVPGIWITKPIFLTEPLHLLIKQPDPVPANQNLSEAEASRETQVLLIDA